MNERQQLTAATYGSSLNTTFGYDSYGYPSSATAGSGNIQSYTYSFTASTGNLASRRNVNISETESFTYDNLDRLNTVSGPTSLTMGYASNGNIQTKSDVGTNSFEYTHSTKPYALTGVETSSGLISDTLQIVRYTSFEQPDTIKENPYKAVLNYNSGNSRCKMIVTNAGNTILTRWYSGSRYIKETAGSVTKEYTFIGGDAYTAPVMAVKQNGTATYYYLLRDHLGSITHVVNTSNALVAQYSFDAWGRRRNPDDWADYSLQGEPDLFAGRGFTGHEHLPWFNLINMNGRLYDPVVARFLSPDNNVQMPDFSQNFNRYSYALNNPLVYIDEDGEIVLLTAILIGAAVGAIVDYGIQVATNYAAGQRGKEAWITNIDWFDVGIGAVVGGISAGAGTGVTASSAFGKSLIKFAGSSTWDLVNVFGVSLITSSFDWTKKEGFNVNKASEIATSYITSAISARAAQVSSKNFIDVYSTFGKISPKSISSFFSGVARDWFVGTAESIIYDSTFEPTIEGIVLPQNNKIDTPKSNDQTIYPINFPNEGKQYMAGKDIPLVLKIYKE